MVKFELTPKSANAILNNHHLGDLSSIEEIKSGSINPVYLLNQKYILRFDLGNPEYKDKLKKESALYSILPQYSVPTPSLIAFDDSCTLSNYPYFIISYLSGQNLQDGFPLQSVDFKNTLSSELGNLLRSLHSIKQKDLNGIEMLGDINSWVDKVKKNFVIYLSHIKDNNYFSADVITQIETVFADYQKISNWEIVASLTHGDINPGNIKMDNGHLTGIFDFEYACIADPFIDFERFPLNYLLGDTFNQQLFLQSYGLTNFSDEQKTRLKTYCLSQGMWEIWATATQQFPYGQEVIIEGKLLVTKTINL